MRMFAFLYSFIMLSKAIKARINRDIYKSRWLIFEFSDYFNIAVSGRVNKDTRNDANKFYDFYVAGA